jgi:hypothetical protein
MPRSPKVDDNSWAASFVEAATGEPKPTGLVDAALKRIAAEEAANKNPAAVALGRLGGAKGGKARAAALTAKQRSDIARKGAQARWASKTEKAPISSKEQLVQQMFQHIGQKKPDTSMTKMLGVDSAFGAAKKGLSKIKGALTSSPAKKRKGGEYSPGK